MSSTTNRHKILATVIVTLSCYFSPTVGLRKFAKLFDNSDAELTTPELVAKHGYPVEIHDILTEDGYALQLHRIPYGRDKDIKYKRRTILLMHGLGGSSADWILMGPEKSLAYVLADTGYDIWLGNNRGNTYSRNHTSLSSTNRTFWNFSYHELGIYDLPAMIDHILNTTGHERILYIGHSEGTTQFFVMASEKHWYNSKISLMIGLAPAAFNGNISGPITKLAKLTYLGVWIGETFGYPEIRSRSSWGKFVSNLFCHDATITPFFCNNMLFLIVGFSQPELEPKTLRVIIGHVPAGASWKQLIHYGQGYINAEQFRQYDYGKDKNLRMYNSTTPPHYKLDKITVPIVFFSSENDWMTPTRDVEFLSSKLSNILYHHKISNSNFSHYDFLWGKSAFQTVFQPILQLLAQYH